MVLITQNRWVRRVERRSQVELHIALLAEEKIGKLVALIEELRRDLPSVREVMEEVERSFDQEDDRAGKGKDPAVHTRAGTPPEAAGRGRNDRL